MSVNNNIVTAPVGLQEVYSLLGVSPKNGVYDVGYLCSNTHGKINMWSRFKPVNILDNYNPSYAPGWYKGEFLDCGLEARKTSNKQDIIDWYNSNEKGWSYNAPWGDKGGIHKSPFRLLDFDGYNHVAKPFLFNFRVLPEVREDGNLSFYIDQVHDDNLSDSTEGSVSTDPGSLRGKEIWIEGKFLNKWYLGVIITDTAGNIKILAAGNKDVDGNFDVGFPVINQLKLPKASYYVYPFLSKEPQDYGPGIFETNNTYIMLPPGITRQTFSVVSREEYWGLEISLTASYMYLLGEKARITAKITVKCDKSAYTFGNNHIYFRFDTSAENSDLLIGEYTEEIPEFTVEGGGGTYTTQINYMIPSAYRSKSFYAYLMLNTGQFTRKAYPRETSNPDLGEPETPDLGGDLEPNP